MRSGAGTMSIVIGEELIQQIKRHGEQSYPDECCGIMLGTHENGVFRIHMVVAMENNQDANRQRRFLITPSQYRDAERIAVEKGQTLLGFYHSHPDRRAIPSAFDTDHALPWFLYVIVSVIHSQADCISAWILCDNRERFEEQSIMEQPQQSE